jgi:hypothetical protein
VQDVEKPEDKNYNLVLDDDTPFRATGEFETIPGVAKDVFYSEREAPSLLQDYDVIGFDIS